MKSLKLLALVGLSISASAMAARAPTVETGYDTGTLAVAAIERGDWTRAEALLTDSRLNADDPARLINLGQVYWATGRQGVTLVISRVTSPCPTMRAWGRSARAVRAGGWRGHQVAPLPWVGSVGRVAAPTPTG